MNVIKTLPLIGQVAAVSCGISAGEPVLDLDYAEDSSADADANFVLTDSGGIVEIQGTAERSAFSEAQFLDMLGLARQGVAALFEAQREAVGDGVMARRLAGGTRLVLASHNPGKLAELADLLRPHDVAVISAGALGLPEPPEDAPDFVGNARIKALAAARASGLPALADDSGFCVAALGGAPGRVFGALGWAGQGLCRRDGAGAQRDGRRRGPARMVRRRTVPRLAGRPHRDLCRPRRWRGDLAAARRQGLWLRPDVRACTAVGRRSARSMRSRSTRSATGPARSPSCWSLALRHSPRIQAERTGRNPEATVSAGSPRSSSGRERK